MTMNLRVAVSVALLGCVLLAAAPARAVESCESKVIKAWLTDRDAVAAQLVRVWLGGGDEATVRRAGLELVRLEILLSPCAPPLRIEEFYVGSVREPERLPAQVLAAILARQGIEIQPQAFFAGRTFRLHGAEVAR